MLRWLSGQISESGWTKNILTLSSGVFLSWGDRRLWAAQRISRDFLMVSSDLQATNKAASATSS